MDWPTFFHKFLHDLVNPLAGAQVQFELLRLGITPTKAVIPEVETQLNRIQDLIEATREMVSLTAETNVSPLTADDLNFVQAELESTYSTLEYTIPWDACEGAIISRDHFLRTFTLLLENAFEQEASEVVFEPTMEGLKITDNGKPFTDKALDHALTPFFSSKKEGIGLGLSLASHIMESYQGKLTLNQTNSPKKAYLLLCLPR